jgi:hypothetical protein
MAHKEYPAEYSIVEVTFIDDTTVSFMINAGPQISDYLSQKLHETGALVLRNERDSLVVPRERLKAFALRKVTKDT